MSDTVAMSNLMDRIYRRQRHLYDSTRKYYLLGRDRLIERLSPPPGCTQVRAWPSARRHSGIIDRL